MKELACRLDKQLQARRENGNLRQLNSETKPYDFLSNDYLGLARSKELTNGIQFSGPFSHGATGSRLLSGNSVLAEETEAFLSVLFQAESCLLYTSGYTANLGLLSAIPQKGDTILYDELSHSSIKDGLRLSFAQRYAFRHNDLEDLEKKLKKGQGQVFVLVESIYSMDGDEAPLIAISKVCARYGAYLIVDEAHSTGIYGENGGGLCVQYGIEEQVFARIFTFGKAIGHHGACIAGSGLLKEYLLNFSRPFIYTTAPPPYSLHYIRSAFEYIARHPELQEQLKDRITFFQEAFDREFNGLCKKIDSKSAVQAMVLPGNERVRNVCRKVRSKGYDVRPILAPTVKAGQERIRICLHVYNSEQEISGLLHELKTAVLEDHNSL